MMLESSTLSLFRNLRRAGTLKNILRTEMTVPFSQTQGSCSVTFEPTMTIRVPICESAVRVRTSTSEMAHIEGSASPRKPMVRSVKRSSAFFIFDVA